MKSYVYKITHPTGKFYIGVRWANKVSCHEDFGKIYFTSTKHELVRTDFAAFTKSFIECETPEEARTLEKKLIKENWGDPMLLNRNVPGEKFHCDAENAKVRMTGNSYGLGNKSRAGQTQGSEERQRKRDSLVGRAGWKPSDEQRAVTSKMAATRPRVCCLICKNEMQINSFSRHVTSHFGGSHYRK